MSADCKQELAELARYRWDDPQGRKLAKAIVSKYSDSILAGWTASLPRRTQDATPRGAWQYLVELDGAWKRWARSVRRELGLVVHASVAHERLNLRVGAQDHGQYYGLASTEVDWPTPPTSELFDRAWAKLDIPLADIVAANRLLRAPHDVEDVSEWLPIFANPRPPRAAPRAHLISWLLSLDKQATAVERAELDVIVVELLAAAKPRMVAPPRSDDADAWTRWLVDVDLAITELNRTLKPTASMFVSLEVIRRKLSVTAGVRLRGIDDDDTGVVTSTGTIVALDHVLAKLGAPRERLKRTGTLLARELHDQLGEKLDNIGYLDNDALEAMTG